MIGVLSKFTGKSNFTKFDVFIIFTVMTTEQQKELFSGVYVRALAAAAGYKVSIDQVDDDSVDMRVFTPGAKGTSRRPEFAAQLKASSENILRADGIHYSLKRKNYDDLRGDTLVPRILIVVLVPSDVERWLRQTEEEMCLHQFGYWMCLKGYPAITTQEKTVILPRLQTLTLPSMREIMRKIQLNEPL